MNDEFHLSPEAILLNAGPHYECTGQGVYVFAPHELVSFVQDILKGFSDAATQRHNESAR